MRLNERISGWRFFGQWRAGRRRTAVRVQARFSSPRTMRMRRFGVASLVLALVCLGMLALWLGACSLGRALFSENDRFALRNLLVKDGEVITEDLVREYTQIREGRNLFALHIGRVREEFLKRVPNVKAMQVRRILPDTLEIEMVERVPLARMGRGGSLAADREGQVFAAGSGNRDLPVIAGYEDSALRPGSRVRGMAEAAIQVLDACDSSRLGLRVAAVDVRNRDHLVVHLADGRPVNLNWEGMGEQTRESRVNLLRKLVMLAQARHSQQGRQQKGFDVTYPDMIVGDAGNPQAPDSR